MDSEICTVLVSRVCKATRKNMRTIPASHNLPLLNRLDQAPYSRSEKLMSVARRVHHMKTSKAGTAVRELQSSP